MIRAFIEVLVGDDGKPDGETVVSPVDRYFLATDQAVPFAQRLQAGLNYNTSRIPGFDTNASVSYNFQRKDARESSSRTNYNTGGANLLTSGNFLGTGTDHTVSGSMEFSNTDQSKFLAILRPYWMYTSRDQQVSRNSTTLSGTE